jgi:L-fuculose-phosphate aldolase
MRSGPARGHRLHAPFPVRESVVRVCRALTERQLIAGQDGNVSVRINQNLILVTPAGMSKGSLDVDDLVEVTPDGTRVGGRHAPSSELGLHLAAYRARAEIGAVVHAHPVTATAFGIVRETIPDGVLSELMLTVGPVALVPYSHPGKAELGVAAAIALRSHDALLLAHHGAVTVGRTLRDAHFAMESLEHGARIIAMARQIGEVVTLDAAAQDALREARRGARIDAASDAASTVRGRDD